MNIKCHRCSKEITHNPSSGMVIYSYDYRCERIRYVLCYNCSLIIKKYLDRDYNQVEIIRDNVEIEDLLEEQNGYEK